jgi:hypothetical protein
MSKWLPVALGLAVGGICFAVATWTVSAAVSDAEERLTNPERAKQVLPTADHAEVEYCTPQFKQVLERVLHSCGLVSATGRRGCQPEDVRLDQ